MGPDLTDSRLYTAASACGTAESSLTWRESLLGRSREDRNPPGYILLRRARHMAWLCHFILQGLGVGSSWCYQSHFTDGEAEV